MTVVRFGWTNPLTDAFGAHPTLGPVLDLNDGTNYVLASPDGLELPPPPRTVVQTGNIRTQGERATRAIYRHNRPAVLRLVVGPAASYAALAASIRTLLAWLDGPPSVPFSVQYQPFGAAAPVYLDVVAAAHDIPADEAQWLRLQFEPVAVELVCRPGLRGDRVTLSNLLANPGFEQGSGPGVPVFADAFANVNAYTVQAGSAPTLSPSRTYVDTVLTDAPLLFFPLSEASGASAYDIAGQGKAGTLGGTGTTQGPAGGISGDTSTAYTLNGSGYVTFPASTTTGLPTGNGAWSIEAWVKLAANPAALAIVATFGNQGTTSGAPQVYINTSGQPAAAHQTGPDAVGTALSLGVWHHLVATWDGTSLRIWQDGTNSATSTPAAGATPNPPTFGTIGGSAAASPASLFTGSVQMVAIYGATLGSSAIAAHYNAGHTGATGTVANAASLPSGGRVSFGSPAWRDVNTWAVRFRYVSGQQGLFFLHYTDANNQLRAEVASGANGFKLTHKIAGTFNTVAQATATLTHEAWYWLQVTQFPCPQGGATPDVPYLAATLSYDANGAVGAQVAQIAGAASDAVTALAGAPQLQAVNTALVLGGLASGQGHALTLFGPGGWSFQTAGAGAVASGAWDAATTYPGGPVASNAAARIDIGSGTGADANWRCYPGDTPAGTWAVPVKAAGDVLSISALTKSAGLGASASTKLTVREYDASGALLRTDAGWTPPSLTGTQAAWASLAGTYTTGTGCAYVDVALRVADATNGSAGGTVWFDNAQVWDQTATGVPVGAMPYCELRFPQSPAQLVVSGLLGDLPAPAFLALGTYDASMPASTVLSFALGRAARASASATFAAASNGYYGPAFAPQSTCALDPASYGGFYVAAQVGAGSGWNPRAFSPKAGDLPGVYHLYARLLTKQSGGNLANVTSRVATVQQGAPWFGKADFSDYYASWFGPSAAPFAASNAWTPADVGQCQLPPYAQGALADPSRTYLTPRPQVGDSTGGSSINQANWQLLLPVDGSLLLGTLQNPSNAAVAYNGWAFAYVDPLGVSPNGLPSAATLSVETAALPNPARGFGGPGTSSTGTLNVNLGADPYLTLDPTVNVPQNGAQGQGQGQGVNQLAGFVADQGGAVLPLYAELAYSPLYLYPR